MSRKDETLPLSDLRVTVEGLLPHNTGKLTTVHILAVLVSCVLFLMILTVFM